jgi:hypothetical protein
MDDEIYEHTMSTFPEMAEPPHDKVLKLDEDWMKSPEGKERWRKFMNSCVALLLPTRRRCAHVDPDRYEGKVMDFNFGSLIRTDANEEYGEKNTIFGKHGIFFMMWALSDSFPQ